MKTLQIQTSNGNFVTCISRIKIVIDKTNRKINVLIDNIDKGLLLNWVGIEDDDFIKLVNISYK